MFAANQGQNKSRGWPLRSLSAMTLMPFISTWSGRSSAAPVASVMAGLPSWAPSVVHDGLALRPVDRYVGAIDEAGPWRGEERPQPRDFFGPADAAVRERRLGRLLCPFRGQA